MEKSNIDPINKSNVFDVSYIDFCIMFIFFEAKVTNLLELPFSFLSLKK